MGSQAGILHPNHSQSITENIKSTGTSITISLYVNLYESNLVMNMYKIIEKKRSYRMFVVVIKFVYVILDRHTDA